MSKLNAPSLDAGDDVRSFAQMCSHAEDGRARGCRGLPLPYLHLSRLATPLAAIRWPGMPLGLVIPTALTPSCIRRVSVGPGRALRSLDELQRRIQPGGAGVRISDVHAAAVRRSAFSSG